jgi:hypothetical protein
MKYQVGDLVLVKHCEYKPRFLGFLHSLIHPRPVPIPLPRPHLHLQNTYGIITKREKHSDVFKSDSTENDNAYFWYSQVDGKEYYFYQDEVEGEIIE